VWKGLSNCKKSYLSAYKCVDKTVPHKDPLRPAIIPQSSTSKFILLGEDDIDDEELLKEVFATIDESIALLFVNNGRGILSTLDEMEDNQLPCLMILDYNMPALNGAEILKELQERKRFHHIPKVIWSTSASNTYKKSCLALGAKDYVIKPTNMDDLKKVVQHMLSFCGT
jgi:CheY-like chemotaxis protein